MTYALIRGFGKFLVEILHYCAWPAVVLVGLYWLRNPIVAAIGRFKKIQHKDTVLEFDPAQLQEGFVDSVDFENATEQAPTWEQFANASETGAIFCGLYILQVIDTNRAVAKKCKPLFDSIIKAIRRIRPDKFWLDDMLNRIKKAVDALELDENA